jgi:5-hydroxyisourate hydrolase
MARISTHVLDIALGKPAAGIAVELRSGGAVLTSVVTNADGRTDKPLLSGDRIEPGFYELVFRAGTYLGSSGFYDDVTIRFRVTDAEGSYHIPLLLSAYGYSTYRGS